MNNENSIQDIRDLLNNGLRLRLTPATEPDLRNTAFAFQNAISQIPDEIILDLMENPNRRLSIHRLALKPDDPTNVRKKRTANSG